jgi:hypothetical protein
MEAPHLEEASLDPAHQVLHRPLLVAPAGRTQFDPEAEVHGQLGERAVPDDGLLLRMDHHRLRVVDHDQEGNSARSVESVHERSAQGFDLLVRHHLDVHPAGMLQPVGGEVDALGVAGKVLNPDLSEVKLGELSGQPLEAHHQPGRRRSAELSHQIVDRRLAALVASLSQPMEQFNGGKVPVFLEPLLER